MKRKRILSHQKLREKAKQIRLDILKAIHRAGKGHIGGAYSIVEILVSLYYDTFFKFDPKKPNWPARDRFILSKGHAGIAMYAVLADHGFFPKKELWRFNRGGLLGEHPDPRVPGIEVISGSLGHGLPIGAGMALSDQMDQNARKTIVLMGDGECYEGPVWEAAMFAAHHKLNNLCAVVDRNRLITYGSTESINRLEPFRAKWESFGWKVYEVDAHCFKDLRSIWASFFSNIETKPRLIVANSIKGKGVSFMENKAHWHHGSLDEKAYKMASIELSKK